MMPIEDIQDMDTRHPQQVSLQAQDPLTDLNSNLSNQPRLELHLTVSVKRRCSQLPVHNHQPHPDHKYPQYQRLSTAAHLQISRHHKECHRHLCLKTIRLLVHHQAKTTTIDLIRCVTFLISFTFQKVTTKKPQIIYETSLQLSI